MFLVCWVLQFTVVGLLLWILSFGFPGGLGFLGFLVVLVSLGAAVLFWGDC